ncbi:MAG: hypothetical protein QOE34_2763, partial [Verrucomicrobiota bacterium]
MTSDRCAFPSAPPKVTTPDKARQPQRARVSLTWAEIRDQHELCCAALIDEALRIDDRDVIPFRIDFLRADGRVVEKIRRRTHTHDNGPDRFDYRVSRDWISLPRADHKLTMRMAKNLRALQLDPTKLWTGAATQGPPCFVNQVGAARRDLMNRVRKFFAGQSRNIDAPELIFSTVQDPVRNRETGQLRQDAAGRLLFHVHVHFLFYPPRSRSKHQVFQYAFSREFGFGSGVEKVKTVGGVIGYLTAVPDRSDLLDHDEFVKWHCQISRAPRFRLYGR